MQTSAYTTIALASSLAAILSCKAQVNPQSPTVFTPDGVAIKGYDVVSYFKDGVAKQGSPSYTAQYQGATFQFVSVENRDIFQNEPSRYTPQYGGFCAFGLSRGYKAATDPNVFTIFDNKLYLNYNKDVQIKWSQDIAGFVAKADKNWPEVSIQTKFVE